MKRCLLVRLISSPDEAIDPLPASPKSDYLTIEYASQVFIVVVQLPIFWATRFLILCLLASSFLFPLTSHYICIWGRCPQGRVATDCAVVERQRSCAIENIEDAGSKARRVTADRNAFEGQRTVVEDSAAAVSLGSTIPVAAPVLYCQIVEG